MPLESILIIGIVSSACFLLLGLLIGWIINARQLKELKLDIKKITRERDDLKVESAKLEATIEEKQNAMNDKMALLQNAEKQLVQQFENTANKIFEDKTTTFKKFSAEQITQLLTPFREQIDGLHKDVKEASKERHTLGKEIEKIVTETNSLTKALKGDSRQQGDWGEVVLERILENTGLRKGVEYEVQRSYTADDGSRLRPDVIVHLPENRDIIIDSKVSLKAYERYVNTESENERREYQQEHLQSVKRHINQLAGKHYAHIPELRTLDCTLMWIPIESAYFAAVQADHELISLAMSNKVIPVSATSLFSVLKVIEKIWQYENQNTNVKNIIERANQLYDKFVGFIESFDEVGRRLNQAQETFGTAKGRLVSGPGNVIRQIEMLREMGLNPKKRLPGDLVQTSGTLIEHDDSDQDVKED